MMVFKFGISKLPGIYFQMRTVTFREGRSWKINILKPKLWSFGSDDFFLFIPGWFLGSLAVDFQGFIHELCSLLEWNWIMGGIFFKSLSPRICSGKPREFFLRGNHGLGWNITLIWKETLILEIHPLSIEPMIVGGRVLRNSKVDGTVPTYWFIRTRF